MEDVLVHSKFESLIDKIIDKATPSRLDRLVGVARQMQLCWETRQVESLEGYRIASLLVERIQAEVKSCRKIRVLYAISAVLRQMNPKRCCETKDMLKPWPVSFAEAILENIEILLTDTMQFLTGKDLEHAKRIFLLWKRENIVSSSFKNLMHDVQGQIFEEDEVESSIAGETSTKECCTPTCFSTKKLGLDRRMKSMSRWSRRVHTMRRSCESITPSSP